MLKKVHQVEEEWYQREIWIYSENEDGENGKKYGYIWNAMLLMMKYD